VNTKQLIVNGHIINLFDEGRQNENTLILLHHGLGSIASWHYQIPFFLRAGFRVIAYDRWGYGKSSSRAYFSMPYFKEDLDDLAELLKMLKVDNANFIGHSDGGTIGLYFASENCENTKSLISVAAHIYIEPKMVVGIKHIQRQYKIDPKFRIGLARLHGSRAENVFSEWMNGWMKQDNINWNMQNVLQKITSPVYVIQGEDDEHSSPKHA